MTIHFIRIINGERQLKRKERFTQSPIQLNSPACGVPSEIAFWNFTGYKFNGAGADTEKIYAVSHVVKDINELVGP